MGNLTEIFGYELDIRASLAQIRAKLTMYQQTQLSYHVEWSVAGRVIRQGTKDIRSWRDNNATASKAMGKMQSSVGFQMVFRCAFICIAVKHDTVMVFRCMYCMNYCICMFFYKNCSSNLKSMLHKILSGTLSLSVQLYEFQLMKSMTFAVRWLHSRAASDFIFHWSNPWSFQHQFPQTSANHVVSSSGCFKPEYFSLQSSPNILQWRPLSRIFAKLSDSPQLPPPKKTLKNTFPM